MIDRLDLLDAMKRECDVCIHLAGKVPPGGADFRFSPAQRSTLELMRYLTFVGLGASRSLFDGNWDAYKALAEEAKTLDAAGFASAMERQKLGLTKFFDELSDLDFASRVTTLPWGPKTKLSLALLLLPHDSLVAYRMQLFLHAKAAGNAAIGTANCWGGIDMPPSS